VSWKHFINSLRGTSANEPYWDLLFGGSTSMSAILSEDIHDADPKQIARLVVSEGGYLTAYAVLFKCVFGYWATDIVQ
jgi:hypothetical protein